MTLTAGDNCCKENTTTLTETKQKKSSLQLILTVREKKCCQNICRMPWVTFLTFNQGLGINGRINLAGFQFYFLYIFFIYFVLDGKPPKKTKKQKIKLSKKKKIQIQNDPFSLLCIIAAFQACLSSLCDMPRTGMLNTTSCLWLGREVRVDGEI